MQRSILPVALVAIALAGCKPTNAKMVDGTGTLSGWLSATSSFTLFKGNFDPAEVDGLTVPDHPVEGRAWNIDCRELDREDADLRLEDPLQICNNTNWGETVMTQRWMATDAWRGFQMPLDPWRGEALMTREGDLQIGFHNRLPGGEDFRWSFAIRPDFQPTTCDGSGESVTAVPIDGDWLGEWSKDLDWIAEQENVPPFLAGVANDFPGGKLYYLNARSYQLNPELLEDIFEAGRRWTLPNYWLAGYARATLSEEDFRARPTYYGDPGSYLQADSDLLEIVQPQQIYFADGCVEQAEFTDGTLQPSQCTASSGNPERDGLDDVQAIVVEDMRDTRREFNLIAPEGVDVDYMPIPHFNRWRPIDDEKAGLDAWMELNHSWVVLSADSDASVGGSVEGAFSILMDPDDSNSRLVVQGRFTVNRVKRETWGGPDLRAEKFEEAGLTPCIDK